MTDDLKSSNKSSAFEEDVIFRLFAAEYKLDILRGEIDGMTVKIQKLEAAYYHQFPERLDKDAQVESQLRALNPNPDLSANPKKS